MSAEMIISGVSIAVTSASLVLPFITANIKFETINNRRKKALNGNWVGTTQQVNGPDGNPMTVSVETKIMTRWRKVYTETTIKGAGITVKSKGTGGFVHGEHILLTYRPATDDVVNFGATLLKFSSDGKQLSGHTVGYGSRSECIINGKIILNKA